jgi:anhydro-N-acetylmuramic acid kinase
MLKDIQQLHEIARCNSRRIIGLMSGTSLDGLDVAMCKISGSGIHTKVELMEFATVPYSEKERQHILQVFAKKEVDFPYLCALNAWVGDLQTGMILGCLEKWGLCPDSVDLIASHGQTVMHAPAHQHHVSGFPDSTLQIGDGDRIAVRTGIITISDFRQKHLAAGGEGAPLAVYGDFLMFSHAVENRIMLNIGGIANFTLLPSGQSFENVLVTDTGPGNTLMDAYMKKHFNRSFDTNGEMAAKGKIHTPLLMALKSHPFFKLHPPATTGPEVFNTEYLDYAKNKSDCNRLTHEDFMATLNRFSAETISDAINQSTRNTSFDIYISGGGAHNSVLLQNLSELLPSHKLMNSDVLSIPPDAKEAVLFAVLANECVAGNLSYGTGTARLPVVSMGKISLPN